MIPEQPLIATGTGDPRDVQRYVNPPIYEQVCRTLKMRPLPEIHHYLDLSTGYMYRFNPDTQVWTILVGDPA